MTERFIGARGMSGNLAGMSAEEPAVSAIIAPTTAATN